MSKLLPPSKLPLAIWAMGLGSLCMDTSSELIHSLLPAFMTSVLGCSILTVGIIEGVAEATASICKVFSGALSDYLGKRKLLMVFGYSLAALTKPLFPLATSVNLVFTARFFDRVGKGIRGAPRDALIADITQPELRGSAYGLRQGLDSIGACLGPLLALILVSNFLFSLRTAMWFATIPAVMAVALLTVFVREPQATAKPRSKSPLKLSQIKRLPSHYWIAVLLGGSFTMARFSEAFLILRAKDLGIAIGYLPIVMIVMNVFYAACAYPAGKLADRINARVLLLGGLGLLILADILLAAAMEPTTLYIGAALWGLHMAATQGLFSKIVADAAPSDMRGTAFGVFNLVSGIALLLASSIAGALWSTFGAPTTFIYGAAFATITIVGLVLYSDREGN